MLFVNFEMKAIYIPLLILEENTFQIYFINIMDLIKLE